MSEDKVQSAIYMIRNFMTGDDEQTRINDSQYWNDLSEPFDEIVKQLSWHSEYNLAIRIYVRHILKGMTWEELEPQVDAWVAQFLPDNEPEDDKELEDHDENVTNLKEDIKTGFTEIMGD